MSCGQKSGGLMSGGLKSYDRVGPGLTRNFVVVGKSSQNSPKPGLIFWVSSIHFFLDFWNMFNFAKPLALTCVICYRF